MKELKFRAWSPEENKFYYFDGIFNKRPSRETSSFPQYESIQEVISLGKVQRCVGIQDKNGKDIFEGDIVKIFEHWDGDYLVPELNVEVRYSIKDTSYNIDWYDVVNYDAEIIGNIHEGVLK